MTHWSERSVFYHIYPLGLSGAPERNDHEVNPVYRLKELTPWLDHAADLGCNALYLGPLFESSTHGYDTTDYYRVDRRLGDRDTLQSFIERAHQLGIKVILDGVFNHVGRDFWAFQDVLLHGQDSICRDWFSGLRFDRDNRSGDHFDYDTWAGHESLVKLNLLHPPVREHLLGAVKHWIEDYQIDGLRLDAADVIDVPFLSELAEFSKKLKSDFWLLGEVVHGDYRKWVNSSCLDSVTNYEAYKGLYSSFNDHNFFEIAWTLKRQFGEEGLYRSLMLYSFADNHDVDRVASILGNPAHLIPLYVLMMTMPGVPSIYYGSEFAVEGKKDGTDRPLRPALNLPQLMSAHGNEPLIQTLKNLIQLRKTRREICEGDYQQLYLSNEQFVFGRLFEDQKTITILNVAKNARFLEIPWIWSTEVNIQDVLQTGNKYSLRNHTLTVEIQAESAQVLLCG